MAQPLKNIFQVQSKMFQVYVYLSVLDFRGGILLLQSLYPEESDSSHKVQENLTPEWAKAL